MADSGSSTATANSPSLTEGVGVWAGVGVGVVRFTIAGERVQSESNHQRSHKEPL